MSATAHQTRFDPGAAEAGLRSTGAELVARATAGGADQAEAFGVARQSIAVCFEKGDLKLTQVDESRSFGVRVVRDQRLGFASSNQAEPAGAVDDALALAALCPPDEHNVLPDARPLPERPSLVVPAALDLTIEQAVEAARELVAATLARDPRLSLDRADLSVHRSAVAVAGSTGVDAAESDASVSLSLFGMAIDGDDVGGFDVAADLVRDPADLPAALAGASERFAEAALGNLAAGAAASYTGPVLFAPQAFQSVFLAPLIGALDARAIQRGRSALAGKLGQAVASPALTVVDDPTDRGLSGAACFDREGQPALPTTLVEDGVLRQVLHNAYSARVDGVASTGHAVGGSRAVPAIGPHGLVLAPGEGGEPDDLRRTLDRGLVIQRFSGTVDPASGDFSGVAKSARWVEDGTEQRSVRETLLQGNAFELLGRLLALSSRCESTMGRHRVPWALVDGVAVTAG